uniref:Retinoic acid receptor responder protein 3-like n=1 Tax=Paramormyrops kingsleyae TaxID=1676925 RepID=A0A3B3Q1N8_9TELE
MKSKKLWGKQLSKRKIPFIQDRRRSQQATTVSYHGPKDGEEACGGSYSMMSVLHDKAIVKMDNLRHVVGTSKFRINNLLDDVYEPRSVGEILKDAWSWVGQELPYCVFRGNCEHFVTELRYGKPESRQVGVLFSAF